MKGLIISLGIFAGYVLSTAAISHVFTPKRHAKIFVPALGVWTPVYFLAYFATPENVFVLPPVWCARLVWLDVAYGYAVFLLNWHSFIDFFFAVNGGFSMCLMFELRRAGDGGLTTSEILEMFQATAYADKIYAWRLPRLAQTGYIAMNQESGVCRLTKKGVAVAILTRGLKRVLNLGSGG